MDTHTPETARTPVAVPLVSVVVPAFNAEETVGETLRSILAQTLQHFEVIVVDDGSTDGTPAVVEEFVRADPRVRLLRQPNAGVAAARNSGIADARGLYLAPCDADDVWHPTKLDRLHRAFAAAPSDVLLAYSASRRIDAEGRVIANGPLHRQAGCVFHRHLKVNLVGNGSAFLARMDAVRAVGGYDVRLAEAGAMGCEDMLLQLRLAARGRFMAVPEYLVGYRNLPGRMSQDRDRMLASALLALDLIEEDVPRAARWIREARINRRLTYAVGSLSRGEIADGLAVFLSASASAPVYGPVRFLELAVQKLRDFFNRVRSGRAARAPFESLDPRESGRYGRPWTRGIDMMRMEWLDRGSGQPIRPPDRDGPSPKLATLKTS